MLELRKCLLHFRFLSQKELDWNGGRQVRVIAWEPNWDVHCHDIVSWLEALRQQRADCTVTAHHLHFEKRIETVLPATRVVRKFIVGSLFKNVLVVVFDAEEGELLLQGWQRLLVPRHGEVVVLGFA